MFLVNTPNFALVASGQSLSAVFCCDLLHYHAGLRSKIMLPKASKYRPFLLQLVSDDENETKNLFEILRISVDLAHGCQKFQKQSHCGQLEEHKHAIGACDTGKCDQHVSSELSRWFRKRI